MTVSSTPASDNNSPLVRGISLSSATALNMIDMIGVGPFITIPLIVSAMGGPQAMLGWVLGAFLAMCDGLVWAELGAAMPGSGGSYRLMRALRIAIWTSGEPVSVSWIQKLTIRVVFLAVASTACVTPLVFSGPLFSVY